MCFYIGVNQDVFSSYNNSLSEEVKFNYERLL